MEGWKPNGLYSLVHGPGGQAGVGSQEGYLPIPPWTVALDTPTVNAVGHGVVCMCSAAVTGGGRRWHAAPAVTPAVLQGCSVAASWRMALGVEQVLQQVLCLAGLGRKENLLTLFLEYSVLCAQFSTGSIQAKQAYSWETDHERRPPHSVVAESCTQHKAAGNFQYL